MRRVKSVSNDDPTIFDIASLYLRAGTYFLIVFTLVAAPAIFVWHARSVYIEEVERVGVHVARSADVMDNFCSIDPGKRMSMPECIDAKTYLARNHNREILENVIDEHMEHIPFVRYCRTTTTCRDMLVLYADTIRQSLFWTIVTVPIAFALIVAACIRWPYRACSRANHARRAYEKGSGVSIPMTNLSEKET